jgi:hypothetical protein
MFLDSFPRDEEVGSRATRPARDAAVEPAKSRNAWPFPASYHSISLPQASPAQAASASPGPVSSSFVT